MATNKNPFKVKAKRGRKVGGVSFCKVSLEELNRILKPQAHVVLSLRFANMIGLKGQTMMADLETVKSLADSKDCDVKLESFETPTPTPKEQEGEEISFLKPTLSLEDFN